MTTTAETSMHAFDDLETDHDHDDQPAHEDGAGDVAHEDDELAHEDDDDDVELAQRGFAGSATQLPHLDRLQQAFGQHDLSSVAAHVGGPAAEAADSLSANAYVNAGRIAFAREPDLRTAAHETTHVLQQRAGMAIPGGLSERSDPAEHHATTVADAVVRGESVEHLIEPSRGAEVADAIQRDEHDRQPRRRRGRRPTSPPAAIQQPAATPPRRSTVPRPLQPPAQPTVSQPAGSALGTRTRDGFGRCATWAWVLACRHGGYPGAVAADDPPEAPAGTPPDRRPGQMAGMVRQLRSPTTGRRIPLERGQGQQAGTLQALEQAAAQLPPGTRVMIGATTVEGAQHALLGVVQPDGTLRMEHASRPQTVQGDHESRTGTPATQTVRVFTAQSPELARYRNYRWRVMPPLPVSPGHTGTPIAAGPQPATPPTGRRPAGVPQPIRPADAPRPAPPLRRPRSPTLTPSPTVGARAPTTAQTAPLPVPQPIAPQPAPPPRPPPATAPPQARPPAPTAIAPPQVRPPAPIAPTMPTGQTGRGSEVPAITAPSTARADRNAAIAAAVEQAMRGLQYAAERVRIHMELRSRQPQIASMLERNPGQGVVVQIHYSAANRMAPYALQGSRVFESMTLYPGHSVDEVRGAIESRDNLWAGGPSSAPVFEYLWIAPP